MLKSVLTNTTVLFSWLEDKNEKPYRRDEEQVPKMGACMSNNFMNIDPFSCVLVKVCKWKTLLHVNH